MSEAIMFKRISRRRGLHAATGVAAIVAALVVVGPAWAQEDQSLDELLDLEQESTERQEQRDAEDGEAEEPAEPEVELDSEMDLDDLALPTEAEGDVFKLAVTDMQTAAERLVSGRDASIETQRVQRRVIDRLDQVISMAQRQPSEDNQSEASEADTGSEQNEGQQQDQQAGADQQSREAAEDERASRGEAEQQELEDEALNERLSEWGNLPPRLRDQLMQGMDDSFSQLYRQLTERYYERLAEQQP